ncbi:GH3 auxin-responsive promoter superfamily [Synechococcus sp. PCC 7335]|uniref:GH3 auxin-responsive promoter family protein n=1 Tax=Synechococcus sp. (strain ATCC 29403 / PCC 7335) TaxID=91464 RepID=UPI00017EC0A4|nr:GH3 auxin-responsive promoter family protein [Synechococcus sp. PCC 7335]EDX83115.1 GH3 auxin-responsive promoter superfamily [Synechococcus sp. PCC 7335]
MVIHTIPKEILDSVASTGDVFAYHLLRSTGDIGETVLQYLLCLAAKVNLTGIEQDTYNADKVQEQLLNDILRSENKTLYGKKYNFDSLNVDSFRSSLPLTSYENYRESIDNVVQTGNYSQLVSEPITLFQESSGTTGKVKLIPRTNKFTLSAMRAFQAIEAVVQSHFQNPSSSSQRVLALVNTSPTKLTPTGIPRGTGTSGGLNDALQKFKLANYLIDIKYSSPSPVFLISNTEAAYYCHLLFGLLDSDINDISANFAATVLNAMKILEKAWTQLVEDIRQGKLYAGLDIDEATRRELEIRLRANPERARELQAYFEEGFEGILPRIWPSLSCIQCITTGSMQLYTDALRYYSGTVPFFSGSYGASEAWIGVNLDPEREPPAFVVTPHTAFFEFIPQDAIDQEQSATVCLTDLKPGESYEVVVTNMSGLYRYRVGDVVRCVGYHHKSPMIEFMYRRQTLLNLFGEKVSEDVIYSALSTTLREFGMAIQDIDYTCRHEFEGTPWRYVVYLEPADYEGCSSQHEMVQQRLDEVLCNLSDRYRQLREVGSIGSLKLKLVREGTFSGLKTRLLSQEHSDSQFKMPRLLTETALISFMESSL